MKTTATKWATKAAGAGAMVLLLATPAFAQSRGDWSRNNNSNRGAQASQTRAGNMSFGRERDGRRVEFDRGRSYRVPEFRDRGLRVGLAINLGGYAIGNGYVRGVVDQVDYRTGTVWLRDEASGREVRAAAGGYALDNLHRGEFVELTGRWVGDGVFSVARIANIQY